MTLEQGIHTLHLIALLFLVAINVTLRARIRNLKKQLDDCIRWQADRRVSRELEALYGREKPNKEEFNIPGNIEP